MPKIFAKTKTAPYDVAEQLRTPEEMAAYLDAWLDEASSVRWATLSVRNGMSQVARCGAEPGESVQSAQQKQQSEFCDRAQGCSGAWGKAACGSGLMPTAYCRKSWTLIISMAAESISFVRERSI
jgi:hypothetical protein